MDLAVKAGDGDFYQRSIVEKNPTPLIANVLFSTGADPFVVTRIKMADTAEVRAIVKAGDRYYAAGKTVEVLEDGCS